MANIRCSQSLAFQVLFASLALSGRIGSFIVTPPWLDAFRDNGDYYIDIVNSSGINATALNETDVVPMLPSDIVGRQSSVFFIIFGQFAFTALVFGVGLLVMLVVSPDQIKDAKKKYSHKSIFISGFCQGVSAWLFNFALSGTRTPPYLQALLANFGIPVQFTVRYIVLRKSSTKLKMICAGVVLVAEFISFIPSIFPGLESAAQHKEDGGSTGPGRILWPICIIVSQIPYAIANALMEKGVQEEGKKKDSSQSSEVTEDRRGLIQEEESEFPPDGQTADLQETREDQNPSEQETKVNILYFSFWWSFYCAFSIGLFFWADLIPHVGTTSNIHVFGETLIFNAKCLFGQAGCGPEVYLLGWANYLALVIATLGYTGLMRHSEGANFVIIVLSLRTPSVFLIWTLCDEHPLIWHPHVSIGTWLSILSVILMLPAIIIYQTGLPERLKQFRCRQRNRENLTVNADEQESNDS